MRQPAHAGRPSLAAELAVLVGLSLLLLAVYARFVPQHVYGYDEADYRRAAERGLAGHWLDRPSISLAEFVASGRASLAGERDRPSASEFIRSSGDLTFLRHYHGPIYWYGLVPAARLAGDGEAALRRSGLLWALLLVWAIYVGCRSLGPGRLAAALAALFAVFSPELIETFLVLNPHPPYVLGSTVALLLAARAIRTGSRAAWWATAAVVGATCATAIFSALLVAALLASAALARAAGSRGDGIAWAALLDRCLLAATLLALLWPGAFLSLTPLRGVAFYGYLALARPATYGTLGPLEAWATRLAFSPLEWGILLGLLFLGAVASWRGRTGREPGEGRSRWTAPLVVYGALMLGSTLLLTSLEARYLASLLPALFVLAAAVLDALLRRAGPALRIALGLVIPSALALNLFLADRAAPLAPDPARRLDDRVVAALKAGPDDVRLVLPRYFVPISQWYLPESRLLGRDRPADLIAAASRWRPDAVAYRGPRDAELEAGLISARGADGGESLTVSGDSGQLTILRFGSGGPRLAGGRPAGPSPALVAPQQIVVPAELEAQDRG